MLAVAGLFVAALAMLSIVTTDSSRIVDTRFGHNERYDRLVLELDREVRVVRRPGSDADDLIVDIEAAPPQMHERIETGFARVGALVLEETSGGARLSSPRRDRQIRLFHLHDPPRLVVDFADVSGTRLSAPTGRAAVPTRAYASDDAVSGARSRTSDVLADSRLEGDPVPTEPESFPPALTGSWARRLAYGFPLALFFGVLIAAATRLCLQAFARLRGGAPAPRVPLSLHARPAREMPVADVITPEDLLGPTDRTELLERRHDEEVSARMRLEERVVQLQEELRTLRENVGRINRRTEGRPS